MILVGNRRGGATDLAAHLMNAHDNDHVHIHELRGFLANELDGAFYETYAIAKGTRCKKFFYSLILSPPETENVAVEAFEEAIERIEGKLGFVGQPRAIVFHEKKGRRHAHCVWSRIDAATMRAIDPYQDKLTLESLAREFFLEHGWTMPAGLRRKEDADPLNYTHAQHQQAKRARFDPKELKRLFAECWERSDSKSAFALALREHGFILAKGDRRTFVAVDRHGEVYSVARWVGVKAKELRARLGSSDDLPSIDETLKLIEPRDDGDDIAAQTSDHLQLQLKELKQKLRSLNETQRRARSELEKKQEERRIGEIKERAAQLPTGLKAVWSKLSGRYEAIVADIETEARRCKIRDREEANVLIQTQLRQRRALQSEINRLSFELLSVEPANEGRRLQLDPAQKLILPEDADAYRIKAKVQRDPIHILKVITDKKESFSRNDIVRGLAEHIDDPITLSVAVEEVMQASELVEVQSSPVPRYSTREMQILKHDLADRALHLSKAKTVSIATRHINSAIKAQDDNLQRSAGASLSDEQKNAIRHCLGRERLSAVVGLAGAGKSTMLSAVRDAYERQGLSVLGAALSGKAADGLESSSGIESRTLASFERSWKKGYSKLTSKDVVVIDEAGMIGTRQMHRFINEVQKTGAKIILVGDPEQLQPINAGTPFKEIIEQIGAVRLAEIHRQKEDWQKQASLDLAEARTDLALAAYETHGKVHKVPNTSDAIAWLVDDYMVDLTENGERTSRLALAHRRKEVFAINQSIRAVRQSTGELTNEILLQTTYGKRAFAPTDRIVFSQNDHGLRIRNGSFGTVQSVDNNQITVLVDADDSTINRRVVTINPKLYPHIDHGYATTIHKSQGGTFDRTYVLSSVLMDRHLMYVAMTRHKNNTHIYGENTSLEKMWSPFESKKTSYPKVNRKLGTQILGKIP